MSRGRSTDSGQSTVELALGIPVLMIVLLGAVQVALVIRGQLLVVHAAREGARAAAVSASATAAAQRAAQKAIGAGAVRELHTSVSNTGTSVQVVVDAVVPTELPVIGLLIGDVHVSGAATMSVEP